MLILKNVNNCKKGVLRKLIYTSYVLTVLNLGTSESLVLFNLARTSMAYIVLKSVRPGSGKLV